MGRWVRVRSDGGEPLHAKVHLLFQDRDNELVIQEAHPDGDGKYSYDAHRSLEPIGALAEPYQPGFWCAWEPRFQGANAIWCTTIAAEGHSWWHRMLGQHVDNPFRGFGIRIGIIDAGFDPATVSNDITVVDVQGGRVDPVDGYWVHGEAICRIIGDPKAPESCAAIAPGAELFFASATYNDMTVRDTRFRFPIADFSPSGHLDPALVTNAIYELALNHEVDLINLSAGVADLPYEIRGGLSEAIETAAECGSVLVCAAGNSFVDRADFPARHPDCIGVSALGKAGWGPEGSAVREFYTSSEEGAGTWRKFEVFHWADSAYGEGVDTIAPGVGILIARDGVPAFDLTGTSFAAPIVTGSLAVALAQDETYLDLPQDQSRSDYVMGRLQEYCQPIGMPDGYQGAGIISLD